MTQDPDDERIRRKAHELWMAEGHPHGRDRDHWDQAKEIIALEDSMSSTLLPRDTGREEPEEPALAIDNLGDLPNLTDQGEHPLTDVSREPAQLSPGAFINATGDTTGAVARPKEELTPDIDDPEIVSTPVKPQSGAPKPAAAAGSATAPRQPAAKPASITTKPAAPTGAKPAKVTGKAAPKGATATASMNQVSSSSTPNKPSGTKA